MNKNINDILTLLQPKPEAEALLESETLNVPADPLAFLYLGITPTNSEELP